MAPGTPIDLEFSVLSEDATACGATECLSPLGQGYVNSGITQPAEPFENSLGVLARAVSEIPASVGSPLDVPLEAGEQAQVIAPDVMRELGLLIIGHATPPPANDRVQRPATGRSDATQC